MVNGEAIRITADGDIEPDARHSLVVPTLAQLDELPPAEAEAWAREVIDALGDRRRMARLHADLAVWLADRLEAG